MSAGLPVVHGSSRLPGAQCSHAPARTSLAKVLLQRGDVCENTMMWKPGSGENMLLCPSSSDARAVAPRETEAVSQVGFYFLRRGKCLTKSAIHTSSFAGWRSAHGLAGMAGWVSMRPRVAPGDSRCRSAGLSQPR